MLFRPRLGLILGICAICVCPLATAASATAATITPNILTDELDNTNTGTDLGCSLREALSIANTDSTAVEPACAVDSAPGDDTISLGTGTYVLSVAGSNDDANATGDLDVIASGGDLTIDGTGAGTTSIDTTDSPAWADRVLNQVSAASGTPLVVRELTITGGNTGNFGGGILALAGSLTLESARVTGNAAFGNGGGIDSRTGADSLSILDSQIDSNSSTLGDGGGGVQTANLTTIDSSSIIGNHATYNQALGGGITAVDVADITVTDSLIANNVAQSTGSAAPRGGGINMKSGSATIRNSTISGNEVLGGASRTGGAVRVAGASTVTIVNSTVSDNKAELSGGTAGGIRLEAGTVNLVHATIAPNPSGASPSAISQTGTLNVRGSIVESPIGLDACAGTITSGGFNVFTDSSCGAPATGDEVDADPLLGPLTDNGGPDAGAPGFLSPIPTRLPAQTSTAVDHVPAANCDDEVPGAPLLTVDERGLTRPFDGDGLGVAECDAGSVEFQASDIPAVTPPPSGSAPAPAAPQPVTKKKCKKKKRRAATAKKCKKRK